MMRTGWCELFTASRAVYKGFRMRHTFVVNDDVEHKNTIKAFMSLAEQHGGRMFGVDVPAHLRACDAYAGRRYWNNSAYYMLRFPAAFTSISFWFFGIPSLFLTIPLSAVSVYAKLVYDEGFGPFFYRDNVLKMRAHIKFEQVRQEACQAHEEDTRAKSKS